MCKHLINRALSYKGLCPVCVKLHEPHASLSSEVIEADVCVVYAKRVEQVEDGLGHHRRTTEVVLDILGGIMLLEAERRPAYREERPPPRRAYSVMLLEAEHRPAYREERPPPRRAYILRSRHPRARQRASLRPPRAHPAPQRLSLTMQSLRLFLVSELNHFSKELRALHCAVRTFVRAICQNLYGLWVAHSRPYQFSSTKVQKKD